MTTKYKIVRVFEAALPTEQFDAICSRRLIFDDLPGAYCAAREISAMPGVKRTELRGESHWVESVFIGGEEAK